MPPKITFIELSLSGDLTITGRQTYDRDNGGIFVAPTVADAAERAALAPVLNEIVVQADTSTIYRWDGAAWVLIGGGGGGGASDHGALTGLADDDHAQYLRTDGARALTGALDAGGNPITNVGNVDGRDVSVDGAKLDGIEAGATADQTAADVPFTPNGDIASASVQAAVVEVRDDTDTKLGTKLDTSHEGDGGAVHAVAVSGGAAGFMTGADKSKIDGIEAGADVTDSANVEAAGAVMDGDFAGSNAGALIRTGAGAYSLIQHNLAAVAAPAVTDDTGSGYSVGSHWIDTVADQVYFCADATVGAAVWRQIGSGGGGGVTDHGALTGLADDDHTQYLLADGTRALTGSLDAGGFAISNVGTVDGRDVSADGTKLDGIESGATADQAASEVSFTPDGDIAATDVQAAVTEVRDDTDTKLAAKADIAHGATHVQGGSAEIDGDRLDIDFTPANYTPTVDGVIATSVDHLSAHLAGVDGAFPDKLDTSHEGAGGAVHAAAVAGGASGFMTGSDKSKLDGIEAGAAADQVASEVTFTPDGDILAGDVQAAVVEVRDDTDTKLTGKLDTSHEGAGGAVHANAIAAGAAGFMTGADKSKLDGIESGATADQSAAEVVFTPNGDIAAADVQAAIVEVRDDADTKLDEKADGAASSTDNALVRFDGITGKILQNSVGVLDDLGNLTGINDISLAGTVDGRDVAADGSKLDGIESGATADQDASEVAFTPDGDIAAGNVQSAIAEVRDDADTKLADKVEIGGQIGGTIASPDVRGLRETSGPALLTLGAIADGEYLVRSGTSITGGTPAGGGSSPTVDILTGFSSGNRYEAAANGYPGVATGFYFGAMAEVLLVDEVAGQAIWQNANPGVDGWGLGIESDHRVQAFFYDTSGAQIASTSGAVDLLNDPAVGLPGSKHFFFLGEVIQNGANNDIRLWVNGTRLDAGIGTNPYSPVTDIAAIGSGIFGNVAENTGIGGVCYYEGVLTPTEIVDWFHACYDARDLVDDGIGMTVFSVKRGSPAATWAESDGTGPDLNLVGSLTAKSRTQIALG